MKVEIKLPEEYEKLIKKLDWENILPRVIARGIEEELKIQLLFERAKKTASKSKLSNKEILELGEELKERVAKRHGLL
jgi:hypothetical protein